MKDAQREKKEKCKKKKKSQRYTRALKVLPAAAVQACCQGKNMKYEAGEGVKLLIGCERGRAGAPPERKKKKIP